MAGNMKEFTDRNWKAEVLDSPIPVIVDFWAPWCKPCLNLAPTIEKLAAEYEGKVKVGKMNCDENQEIPGTSASSRSDGRDLPGREVSRPVGRGQRRAQVQRVAARKGWRRLRRHSSPAPLAP